MELKQIYDVQNLKLRFKTKKALEIKVEEAQQQVDIILQQWDI